MSKRSKRRDKAPNLPEATLARARAQLNQTETSVDTEEKVAQEVQRALPVAADDEEAERPAPLRAHATAAQPISSRERTRRHAARMLEERDSQRQQLDSDLVRQMLANPTKFVSEEELRQQYGYVIQDLRSMWTLAVGLFIVLIIANIIFL